jgi:predicted amidohydrolase
MENGGALRISMIQIPIVWEDINANISRYGELLKSLKSKTDLAVLPEFCTTGWSLHPEELAESNDGTTVSAMKQYAKEFNLAVAGSFMASDTGRYFNRAFFVTPDGQAFFYDKRHLFAPGGEDRRFSPGTERLIVAYRGWKICLMVCYDLRFPVWSRKVDNEYDLLIYVANWAAARKKVWRTLMEARAIENMCYVCGVNCVGTDHNGYDYHGDSQIFSPKGVKLYGAKENETAVVTGVLKREDMENLRTQYPVWKDADRFEILDLRKCPHPS